jgi:putative acetyltransferase
MTELKIRHSTAADAASVCALFACPRVCAGTLQLPYPPQALWEQRMSAPQTGHYSLVAELEGAIVGQLGLEANQRPRRKHVGSLGMGVHDDFQGQGIGSRLMEAALDLADNWLDLRRIELTVYTDNQAAIALYKKYGFIIEGEAANYAFRNGQFVSVYHLARFK